MKQTICLACLALLCMARITTAQLKPVRHPLPTPLSASTRDLFNTAMSLMDASYDSQARLLRRPHAEQTDAPIQSMVRESSWYALGLLLRDRAGAHPADAQRALDVLATVLDQQFLDPQKKWYGTFKRSPGDPLPQPGDADFSSFDPNWRQFIGTTLQMVLIEYPDRIPMPLQQRMVHAIDAAIEGEIQEDRLLPSYTNIALLHGALLDFAAAHDRNPDWQRRASAWNEDVFRLYQEHGTFSEFNAPTYDGVDLYGLALWRDYGSTQRMRDMAHTMEAGLWTEIASVYQPALRNLAGPYDRAYGMDMSSYVTPTGVWMSTVLSPVAAPLPGHPTLATFQVADLWLAPQATLLGAQVPAAALARLRHFEGPHLINRAIDFQRTATTWVGADAIWGGEFTSRSKSASAKNQFHPVTVQWRLPSGQVGWIQLTRSPAIDAVADSAGVTIATDGDVSFRLFFGAASPAINEAEWSLPGLAVSIQTAAHGFSSATPLDCDTCVDLTYRGVHTLRMDLHPLAR